ncbi:uncharacterized protein MELLADRAFT_90558 [Melampsora larici-populina 98AG31]|uniref:AP180 N-terminal homology (ANTH) domain-containing protein n=1 Tax=Melampsora larici-populina (strain 98AG31 / pathotype 3-4-7) TaxID=747676 RepID=F4RXC4_MELLP|nr:uncharacterized protein MELLADRAFT_90558 [Melampsora larici-populina 98AG31]EGG02940.1 hypothetical protein MELLADRAFT_90558 [Melampsora larici-populina 98AG31]
MFKALIMVHKVLQEDHPLTVREGQPQSGYGALIHAYVSTILAKHRFHRQHPEFDGLLQYKEYISLNNIDDPNEGAMHCRADAMGALQPLRDNYKYLTGLINISKLPQEPPHLTNSGDAPELLRRPAKTPERKNKYEALANLYSQLRTEYLGMLSKFKAMQSKANSAQEAIDQMERRKGILKLKI